MLRTNPFVSRLGLMGLGSGLLVSALVLGPACTVATDPALQADGGAAIPPGGGAAPDDAGAGAAGGAPSADAAPDLPHDKPPIDELTYDGVEVATFALG